MEPVSSSQPNHPRHKAGGIYRAGKRSAADGRLGAAGRQQRVADLEERLCQLLRAHTRATTPAMPPHERDFTNLVEELARLLMAEELFTFEC